MGVGKGEPVACRRDALERGVAEDIGNRTREERASSSVLDRRGISLSKDLLHRPAVPPAESPWEGEQQGRVESIGDHGRVLSALDECPGRRRR